MFGIILLSACTLMHLYVFRQAATIPFVKAHISGRYIFGIGIGLWALFFTARMLRHRQGEMAGMLETFGMNWMGVLFLLFVCLLAVDLVTGFGLFLARVVPSLRGGAAAAGLLMAAVALVQGFRPPVVESHNVQLPGLPQAMDGMVIAAVTDMHLGSHQDHRWLEARISQVEALKPDLVVLVGDNLDGDEDAQRALLPVLRRLDPPLGVWAVLGNHEFYAGPEKSQHRLEAAGITVLRNRWAEVRPGLVLAGVDDLTAGRRRGAGSDFLRRALAGRPPAATVLLSHTPWQVEKAAGAGVGLMLCGHTHGGQIWPFGHLVRLFYPFFQGCYQVNGMTTLVCRGTGTWGPRMRLWPPGEILCITLHSAQQNPR